MVEFSKCARARCKVVGAECECGFKFLTLGRNVVEPWQKDAQVGERVLFAGGRGPTAVSAGKWAWPGENQRKRLYLGNGAW